MDVLMPQLGETVAEGTITQWFKAVGDKVEPGDNLFEIETDKATMEVPSTTAGRLAEIRVPTGAVAPVGAVVAVISGGRDLITPPAVAERVASVLPNAVLLTLSTMAHSAIDFREPAALIIATTVWRGELDGLAEKAAALDALPARPGFRLLWKAIDVAAAAEAVLPAVPPGLVRRVAAC